MTPSYSLSNQTSSSASTSANSSGSVYNFGGKAKQAEDYLPLIIMAVVGVALLLLVRGK